ncbi:MAG TPA: SgcJ/EcaC family oxidoreductase [Sphingomicrobium sp.]|nr:SgcJ/EcaC family oxidoreductase [Sphingomicrobium sp.]
MLGSFAEGHVAFAETAPVTNLGLTNSIWGNFNMPRTIKFRSAFVLAAGAATLVAFGSSSISSAAASSMHCERASKGTIEAQFKRFNDSWQTGDPDKVTALFLPDAVLLATVSNKPRTTHAEIRDYFEHFLVSRPIAKIDTSTIRLGCNTATRVGTWTIALTDPKTHKKSSVRARYSFVYKFDRGDWWIKHLHSSLMPETGASAH